jgi:2-C-methyl-D-erythritol 4-phosphate cytidylyltransferase
MGETDLDNVRGSSELAYKNGMKIRLIKGDEHNYKITTLDDLKKFQLEIKMR